MGLHMNPDNRWIQMADKVPWDLLEVKYAGLFPSGTGNVAKLLRMALGSLIIQNRFQFPDRELVEQITENPYLQYFIGLPGYQDTPPFDASTLVLFRKRITEDMLCEANEYLLAHNDDDQPKPPAPGNGTDESRIPKKEEENKGSLAIDATCAPANIRYPQDISLLNEAREKLEYMIYPHNPPKRVLEAINVSYRDNIQYFGTEYVDIDIPQLSEIAKAIDTKIIGQSSAKRNIISNMYKLCNQ